MRCRAPDGPQGLSAPAAIEVSAPGKLILMGEHAVVYRRPALLAAVGLRLRVSLASITGDTVELTLSDLGHRERTSWAAILDHTRRVRASWLEFANRPSVATFGRVNARDPAHLVKVALGEAAQWFGERRPPGLRVRVHSALPVGAGLGSSAALAVAVIRAYLLLRDVPCDRSLIERLAMEVERRQHGNPSGVDAAAVVQGGVLWAERRDDAPFCVEPVAIRSSLMDAIRIFDTGPPAEPTGAVVAAAAERVRREPARFRAVFDRMERATRTVRASLGSTADTGGNDVVAAIREYQRCLEALGVVPEPVRRQIRAIERRGGAAKISGAGALTGTGAGSILVYHTRRDELDDPGFPAPWPRRSVPLGAAGAQREGPR